MPLQINDSSGSVCGFPLMYQMMRANTKPGMTIMLPMMMVRRVRMLNPRVGESRRCAFALLPKSGRQGQLQTVNSGCLEVQSNPCVPS